MHLLPGLLPLWRGDGECQIGADPRVATVLTHLDPTEHRLLDALRFRPATVPRAGNLHHLAALSDVDPARARMITSHLRSRGMLAHADSTGSCTCGSAGADPWGQYAKLADLHAPAASAPPLSAADVVVMGGGRMGLEIAQLLAEAGVGGVSIHDDSAVTPADVTWGGYRSGDVGRPRQHAATALLRVIAPEVRQAGPAPSLVVLVEQRVAVPFRSSGLQREDIPHLSVITRELDVVVGPLVHPGRTACLRCLDLHRCKADPAWPAIATQLAAAPAPALPAPLLRVGAAMAAVEVMAVLTGREVALAGRTAEIGPGALPQLRRWRPHPECGCLAVGQGVLDGPETGVSKDRRTRSQHRPG